MKPLRTIIIERLVMNVILVTMAVCAVIAAESNEVVVHDPRPDVNVEKAPPKEDPLPNWTVTF